MTAMLPRAAACAARPVCRRSGAAGSGRTNAVIVFVWGISSSDWFYNGAKFVYENGLMQGTSPDQFSPYLTTTRGMIVTILYRLEHEPAADGRCPFGDVNANAYYGNAVAWAAAHNIVGGYDKDTFGPDDPVTREQMAAILYRYASYKGYDLTKTADLSGYSDAGNISGYAGPAMSRANANSLVNGKGGSVLDPKGRALRCEAAEILYRFCNTFAG